MARKTQATVTGIDGARVFISFSGKESKEVAVALRKWLPLVIQQIRPWVSEKDIEAGERWGLEIASELETTRFGILCLTKRNLASPWVHFEAGAISKAFTDSRACPYLFKLEPSDIPNGPLSQFHAKRANEKGTKELVESLNRSLPEGIRLADDALAMSFEKWWPNLESMLKDITSEEEAPAPKRSVEEMVKEVLDEVRAIHQLARSLGSIRDLSTWSPTMRLSAGNPTVRISGSETNPLLDEIRRQAAIETLFGPKYSLNRAMESGGDAASPVSPSA